MWLTQNLLSEGDLASVFLRVDLFSLNKVECGIPKHETDERISALADAGWTDPSLLSCSSMMPSWKPWRHKYRKPPDVAHECPGRVESERLGFEFSLLLCGSLRKLINPRCYEGMSPVWLVHPCALHHSSEYLVHREQGWD